jgi:2-polyprenyl-3-methyl-5-hydroxy-6-metoxy-1,4-benzoquinol methylase
MMTRPYKHGVEQPPDFYDHSYRKRGHWKVHYTESHYYPLWTVIADRIRQARPQRILDIGCGPGQVACLMRDIGVPEYRGLDFSAARVGRARDVCPEFNFVAADVFQDDSLDTYPYDCVLMMEFLEHIERDIDVLQRVRPGTIVLATVPNFPAAGHVRRFASVGEVQARYGAIFARLDVASILANKRGTTYYILQAAR